MLAAGTIETRLDRDAIGTDAGHADLAEDGAEVDHAATARCGNARAGVAQADAEATAIKVTADASTMSADQSVSLGLIVTELVINSLKHAYPDQARDGRIEVNFASTPEGWTLIVADDGVGLPQDHEMAKPGLGTGIVQALAGQLFAEVAVVSGATGTTVTVAHRAARADPV